MKLKLDRGLLPVKAHFFFFFAALGPLLPQMNVFGRQLGVSAGAMGLVTAVLPLMWAAAKPLFGYLVDYFTSQRKLIFMLLIALMTGSYCGLWFVPAHTEPTTIESFKYHLNDTVTLRTIINDRNNSDSKSSDSESESEKYTCHWDCLNTTQFEIYISNASVIDTFYVSGNVSCEFLHMDSYGDYCKTIKDCNIICLQGLNMSVLTNSVFKINDSENIVTVQGHSDSDSDSSAGSFYTSAPFWWFVVLMCVGTVAFNVANCISDAICFDVLGPDRGSRYGSQRAWGTVGYGVTALLGGWLVDRVSPAEYKDFTPAFVLALAFTAADLFSCRALKLPSLAMPEDSGKALRELLRMPKMIVFIIFAVIAGTFDSFIIYYMFWFLEELADQTGHLTNIKLIEGIVVAGQCFVGELLFFFLSGRIINRWGFGKTMSFSLLCYGIRLGLISIITNPWQLVFLEAVMQGPTYALCYSCIVGRAAEAAPPGYSATVQGVVAGMDDGVGFAVGSLLGGLLYSWLGARAAFRLMAGLAAAAAVAHALLSRYICETDTGEVKQMEEIEIPEEGEKMLQDHNFIYKDTTVPIDDR